MKICFGRMFWLCSSTVGVFLCVLVHEVAIALGIRLYDAFELFIVPEPRY